SVITHCNIGLQAIAQAHLKTPIHVVPVPLPEGYFRVPAWDYRRRSLIEALCYVFPQSEGSARSPDRRAPMRRSARGLLERARHVYHHQVRPRLPGRLAHGLSTAIHMARLIRRDFERRTCIPYPARPAVEMSGVVYTSIFNSQ